MHCMFSLLHLKNVSTQQLTDHSVPVIVYVRSGSPAVPDLRGPCGRLLFSPLTQRVEDRTSSFVQSVSHDGVTYLGVNTCRCSLPHNMGKYHMQIPDNNGLRLHLTPHTTRTRTLTHTLHASHIPTLAPTSTVTVVQFEIVHSP